MGVVKRSDGKFELVRQADKTCEVNGFIDMDVDLE